MYINKNFIHKNKKPCRTIDKIFFKSKEHFSPTPLPLPLDKLAMQ